MHRAQIAAIQDMEGLEEFSDDPDEDTVAYGDEESDFSDQLEEIHEEGVDENGVPFTLAMDAMDQASQGLNRWNSENIWTRRRQERNTLFEQIEEPDEEQMLLPLRVNSSVLESDDYSEHLLQINDRHDGVQEQYWDPPHVPYVPHWFRPRL